MAQTQKGNNALQKALAATNRLWDAGNPKWFDYLADDAVVYSIGQAAPFVGRKAYEAHYRPILTNTKRKTKLLHRKIQDVEKNSIVSQTIQIVQDGIIANIRQSLVWSRTGKDDAWKIRHLHSALVGTPTPAKTPRTAGMIRVLNERIATIAAVVGVAQ